MAPNWLGILLFFVLSGFMGMVPSADARPVKSDKAQRSESPIPHSSPLVRDTVHLTSTHGKLSRAVKKSNTAPPILLQQIVRGTRTDTAAGLENTHEVNKREIGEGFGEINRDPIIPRPKKSDVLVENESPNQRRSMESTRDILLEKTKPQQRESESARFVTRAEGPGSDGGNFLEDKIGRGAQDGDSVWYKRNVQQWKIGAGVNELGSSKREIKIAKRLSSDSNDGVDTEANGSRNKPHKKSEQEDRPSSYDDRTQMSNLGIKTGSDENMLQHLLNQGDGTMAFGTPQEAREESHLIKEIEKMSQESSVLPKGLHLPYTNGPLDSAGMNFANMDISVGGLPQDQNDDSAGYLGGKGENDPSYLKRNSIAETAQPGGVGHVWKSRNRDRIPREYIETPRAQRFPAIARFPPIEPPQLDEFHTFPRFPLMPPALLYNEGVPFREPVPQDERAPIDEPPPVSEYLPMDEPAPIPELPSIREIPPIDEPTHPPAEALNPKETFGDKKSKLNSKSG